MLKEYYSVPYASTKGFVSQAGEPKLFCDMDGVLVDFRTGFINAFGFDPVNEHSTTPEIWKRRYELVASKSPEFWATLPWMPDGKKLWNYVKNFNPQLLTAVVESDPNCRLGKTQWITKNIDYPISRVHMVKRADKAKYALASRDIPAVLIDDHQKNINEWKDAGGIPVLHMGTNSTIQKLKALGFVKT